MTKIIKRALVALASASLLAGALVLQTGAAHAVPVGTLTVSPGAGTTAAPMTLTSGGACSDPAATYMMVTISGAGFAAGGTNVVGAIALTALNVAGSGYVISLSNTLATIASLHEPAVTYSGAYVLDARCRTALDPTSLGDFTATIHFTDPHTWAIGPMPPAPHFTVAAHLTGTARVGFASGCTASVAGATSVHYAWFRNQTELASKAFAYVATPADAGHTLECEVIAANASGTILSRSPGRRVGLGLLRVIKAPYLAGSAVHGHALTCRVGTWSPGPSVFRYTWLLNGSPIARATYSTFKIPTAYRGHTLACQLVASRVGYANVVVRTSAVKVS